MAKTSDKLKKIAGYLNKCLDITKERDVGTLELVNTLGKAYALAINEMDQWRKVDG